MSADFKLGRGAKPVTGVFGFVRVNDCVLLVLVAYTAIGACSKDQGKVASSYVVDFNVAKMGQTVRQSMPFNAKRTRSTRCQLSPAALCLRGFRAFLR